MHFLERAMQSKPLVLDGATGTELERRAVPLAMPLWSARALLDAPDVLAQIHTDYVRAGADILTANTFRTHRRTLDKAGLGARAAEFTALAVQLARQALTLDTVRPRWVAGSMAPLEDCYSPQLVPSASECETEHAEMAHNLANAGVDVILVETMNSIREARAATRAALATGLPTLTGFVCNDAGRLMSGESVTEAVNAIAPLGVVGMFINCTPVSAILPPFVELHRAVQAFGGLPLTGLYANVGHVEDISGWSNTADLTPLEYARVAARWMQYGPRLIGGCCGTNPAHIAALRIMVDANA